MGVSGIFLGLDFFGDFDDFIWYRDKGIGIGVGMVGRIVCF